MINSQATTDISRRLVSEALRNRGVEVNELRSGNVTHPNRPAQRSAFSVTEKQQRRRKD